MRRPAITLYALGLAVSTTLFTMPAAHAAPARLKVRTACALEGFEDFGVCVAEPSGGTEPYGYLWTNIDSDGTSGDSPYSSEQIECGSRWVRATVTVTDATGATAHRRTRFDCAPPSTGETAGPLKARAACVDTGVDPWGGYVMCAAQPSGGTAPYSYEWTAADAGGVYDQQPVGAPEFFCSPGPARFVLTVTDAAGTAVRSVHDLMCVNDGT